MSYKLSKVLASQAEQEGIKFNVNKIYVYLLCLESPAKEELLKGNSLEQQLRKRKEDEMLNLMRTYLFGEPEKGTYLKIDDFMKTNSLWDLFCERLDENDFKGAKDLAKALKQDGKDVSFVREVFPKGMNEPVDAQDVPTAQELYVALFFEHESFQQTVRSLNAELDAIGRENDRVEQKSFKNAGGKTFCS